MSRRDRAAYTLVEMIVALAILSILLVVLVTRTDSLTPGSRLAAGAREVGAAVRYASSESVTSGKTWWLTYDLDDDEYWIVTPRTDLEERIFGKGRSPTGREDDKKRRRFVRGLPTGVHFKDLVLGEADVREKKEHKLEFSPLGLSPAHTVHLQYEEDRELQLTVAVNPLTGEAVILEGYEAPYGFVKPEAP